MNYFEKFSKKPFVIAEIGSNFDQDFNKLKELIVQSKKAGANAVKLQVFDSSILYPNKKSKTYKIFKSMEFDKSWYVKTQKFCKKNSITLFASSFDKYSTKFLIDKKTNIIKFASSEANKISDIIFAAKFNQPIIFSTGMSEFRDIVDVVDIFKRLKNENLCLMHCSALYPPKLNELNLLSIAKLKNIFNVPIGFSDHTTGSLAACIAVSLGATIFEKHITLDKSSNGPDHFYATEPHEFKKYVNDIKKTFKMMGEASFEVPHRVRTQTRRSSLFWKKNLKKKTIIEKNHIIEKKNSFLGVPTFYQRHLLGQILQQNVKSNSPINFSQFKIK